MAADASGNAYTIDGKSSEIGVVPDVINEYSPSGTLISTTPLATATDTFQPYNIAVDPTNSANIYVTDPTHNQIFKLAANGGTPTVFAGSESGTAGTADGTGTAASFNGPTGIATDACGNLYVADNGSGLVRRITPQGVVTTVYTAPAGTVPTAVALDSGGNLYVTTVESPTIDSNGNTIPLRACGNSRRTRESLRQSIGTNPYPHKSAPFHDFRRGQSTASGKARYRWNPWRAGHSHCVFLPALRKYAKYLVYQDLRKSHKPISIHPLASIPSFSRARGTGPCVAAEQVSPGAQNETQPRACA